MTSDSSGAPEPLRYEMLGEDHSTSYEKLEKYKGEVDWKYLSPHFLSGVLFFVDPEIDLVNAGLAFANDDREQVTHWKKRGDIVKIEEIHIHQWKDSEVNFEALVVSPFVLFRPV